MTGIFEIAIIGCFNSIDIMEMGNINKFAACKTKSTDPKLLIVNVCKFLSFFKIHHLCSTKARKKENSEVFRTHMRISKWWQKFPFWVNYPFNPFPLHCFFFFLNLNHYHPISGKSLPAYSEPVRNAHLRAPVSSFALKYTPHLHQSIGCTLTHTTCDGGHVLQMCFIIVLQIIMP